MNASNTSIEARIRKLLALAMDQPNTPEGELASQRAAELMNRYSIYIHESTPTPPKIEKITVKVSASSWRHRLCFNLQRLCGCVAILGNANPDDLEFWLYGYPVDIERLIYLWTSLSNQCVIRYRLHCRARLRDAMLEGRRTRNTKKMEADFKMSFAKGVGVKVRQVLENQRRWATAESTSLAVLDHYSEVQSCGILPPTSPHFSDTHRVCGAGFEAGKSASFAQGIGSGRTQFRLGQ